jgi:small subunit ribosomal protein S13
MARAKKKDSSGGKGKGGKNNKKPSKFTKGKKDNFVSKVAKPERIANQPTRKAPSHLDLSKETKDFKHVVRISGRDVPGFMSLKDGLAFVYGLGIRLSKVIENVFNKKTNKIIKKVGYLTDDDVVIIEKIIIDLDKEVPSWLLNRVRTMNGSTKHLIMADLRLENRKDLQILGKTKSYRGLRLQWGLTVRGQKTKSSFRKGGAVGVNKKK